MEGGIQPIRKKFLQPNYLFALEWREGFIFCRVIRRRICQYKPLPLVNERGEAIDIEPGGYVAEIALRDPRNPAREILYLDTATNSGYAWILHGSIGIMPEQIYMYPRFPAGSEIPGKFPGLDPIRPSQGDNLGYINYEKSPYEEPTDYVEFVIPPKLSVGFEFYNKDTERSHQPVLNVLFAVYWFQVLDPDEPWQRKLIGKIARREVPAAFLTVGWGDTPVELGGILVKEWSAKPLSLDEASEL